MNPYVFVVGCPRSGTTLLTRLLNAHPRIALLHELHWLPRIYRKRLGVTADGVVTPELVPRLLRNRKFHKLRMDEQDLERLLEPGEPISYSAFVTRIFDLYGDRMGKDFVGEKSPHYVHAIPLLHELWPHAKFIHLVRDGRDVQLSISTWKNREGVRHLDRFAERAPLWKRDPASASAFFWESHVRVGRQSGAALGPDLYYELQYEHLVADPGGECADLCAFLEVPYDNGMLRYHEGRQKTEPGLSAKDAWLPPTPGLRDWRTEMAADDVVRFEAAAGDLLDELGYDRGAASIPQDELDHAAALRAARAERASVAEGAPAPAGTS